MPAFWFHYNKPASQAAGEPVMTVHYKGQCHLVTHVDCRVPVRSRKRATQPRVVMAGRGRVQVLNSVATITEGT
jgi:hypothetical protein